MKRKSGGHGKVWAKCRLFLAAIFLTWASAAAYFFAGNVHFVTNLNDNGPGSLRESIAAAQPGDTIFFGSRGPDMGRIGGLLGSWIFGLPLKWFKFRGGRGTEATTKHG
jgi:hypothetical protein